MRISVNHEDGGPSIVETDEPISIAEVLNKLDIASSTVLAVLGETIVPHSSIVTEDLEIELIVVSSGG
jgi:sulfur carrier protein ThiS